MERTWAVESSEKRRSDLLTSILLIINHAQMLVVQKSRSLSSSKRQISVPKQSSGISCPFLLNATFHAPNLPS